MVTSTERFCFESARLEKRADFEFVHKKNLFQLIFENFSAIECLCCQNESFLWSISLSACRNDENKIRQDLQCADRAEKIFVESRELLHHKMKLIETV